MVAGAAGDQRLDFEAFFFADVFEVFLATFFDFLGAVFLADFFADFLADFFLVAFLTAFFFAAALATVVATFLTDLGMRLAAAFFALSATVFTAVSASCFWPDLEAVAFRCPWASSRIAVLARFP
ncbi:signal transduction histidine kinase [Bradyrhizobium sp. S3.9.2]|uniref:hypothetical protein n=1 Tax=Bradyrhizobium sp. S3.9.2 TaxID=3156432 RepID=UPI00339588B2